MKIGKTTLALSLLVLATTLMASAATITFNTVTGAWGSPVPGGVTINNGNPTSTIRWGVPDLSSQSSYDFTANVPGGSLVVPPSPSGWIELGTFAHHNWPIYAPFLESVQLTLNVGFTIDATPVGPLAFVYTLTHDETPNEGSVGNCPYPSTVVCSDKVSIGSAADPITFTVGGVEYTLALAFSTDGGATFQDHFITQEKKSNFAKIYGQFTTPESDVAIPEPGTYGLMLSGLIGLLALARRAKKRA